MNEHVDDGRFGGILSTREIEALELTALGRTNGEIAEQMGVTVHAVKFHLASIYRKLGVTNRTEAAIKFIENGRQTTARTG
jgi:DNA-binding CsgD family transcriptional regulator